MKVWSKAHALTLSVYRMTAEFPREEVYGLTSQTRRSAASIPANIAEGVGRGGRAELAQFLRVARGSASELEYHLLLAHDLGFLKEVDHADATSSLVEVKRMLTSFIQKPTADG